MDVEGILEDGILISCQEREALLRLPDHELWDKGYRRAINQELLEEVFVRMEY